MIRFIVSIQIQMYFKLNNYFVSAFIIFEKSFAQLQIVVFFFWNHFCEFIWLYDQKTIKMFSEKSIFFEKPLK